MTAPTPPHCSGSPRLRTARDRRCIRAHRALADEETSPAPLHPPLASSMRSAASLVRGAEVDDDALRRSHRDVDGAIEAGFQALANTRLRLVLALTRRDFLVDMMSNLVQDMEEQQVAATA